MYSRVCEKRDLLMQIGVCVCAIMVSAPSSPVNRVEGGPLFSSSVMSKVAPKPARNNLSYD